MWTVGDNKLRDNSGFKLTDDLIRASYHRCEQSGLCRTFHSGPLRRLNDSEQSRVAQKLAPLKSAMGPSFFTLVKALPGDEKFCLLTDARGYVVDICGSTHILIKAATDMQIREGALFDEKSFGTTAISLALEHQLPVYLSGEEHYCRIFHESECLGIPLFDSRNNVFACIGVFSYLGSSLANNVVLEIVRKFLLQSISTYEYRNSTLPTVVNQDHLSRRQLQVIQLRAKGYLNKQIADKLNIHLDTVKEHVSAALRRLNVRSVAEAVLILYAKPSSSQASCWHDC